MLYIDVSGSRTTTSTFPKAKPVEETVADRPLGEIDIRDSSSRHHFRPLAAVFGFLGSAIGTGLSVLIFYTLLIATLPGDINAAAEQAAIGITSLAHIPVLLIEGVLTSMLVLFLMRVKPTLLEGFDAARPAPATVPATAVVGEQGEAARA